MSAALTALLLSTFIFFATSYLPGDAATTILGDNATPEALAHLRERLGLDRPVAVQYVAWLSSALTGDLGISTTTTRPVTDLVLTSLGNSLVLAFPALVLSTVIGIALGLLAARRPGGRLDGTILLASYIGVSVPDFVVGPMLILIVSVAAISLPSSGIGSLQTGLGDVAAHLVLPILTLLTMALAHLIRQTRAGMLDVLSKDYIRTARLKGLSEDRVLRRHVLPNGLNSVIPIVALGVGYLLGNMVIVEEIFAYPGIGRLTIYAVANRDLPLIQGTTLTIGLVFIVSNIVGDLLQAWLDPRIRG